MKLFYGLSPARSTPHSGGTELPPTHPPQIPIESSSGLIQNSYRRICPQGMSHGAMATLREGERPADLFDHYSYQEVDFNPVARNTSQ